MTKLAILTLVGPNTGQTKILLDRYSFIDGECRVDEQTGVLAHRVLRFFGVELSFENVEKPNTDDKGVKSESLGASLTRGSSASRQTPVMTKSNDSDSVTRPNSDEVVKKLNKG